MLLDTAGRPWGYYFAYLNFCNLAHAAQVSFSGQFSGVWNIFPPLGCAQVSFVRQQLVQ